MKLIHFKDEGQDFTEWVVGDDNIVIEAFPFQTSTWKGVAVFDLDKIKRGDLLTISRASDNRVVKLKHPVESIETRPGVPDDYTFKAYVGGYNIFFRGRPLLSTIDAREEKEHAIEALITISKIILGRDKTYDRILNHYLEEAKKR